MATSRDPTAVDDVLGHTSVPRSASRRNSSILHSAGKRYRRPTVRSRSGGLARHHAGVPQPGTASTCFMKLKVPWNSFCSANLPFSIVTTALTTTSTLFWLALIPM